MTAEWHSLSEEAKEPHRKQTEAQKARYDAEMKVYKTAKAEAEATQKKAATESKLIGKKRPASKSADKKEKPAAASAKPVLQAPQPGQA